MIVKQNHKPPQSSTTCDFLKQQKIIRIGFKHIDIKLCLDNTIFPIKTNVTIFVCTYTYVNSCNIEIYNGLDHSKDRKAERETSSRRNKDGVTIPVCELVPVGLPGVINSPC